MDDIIPQNWPHERECKSCHITKPIDSFIVRTKKTKSGISTEAKCDVCRRERSRQHHKTHAEYYQAYNERRSQDPARREYKRQIERERRKNYTPEEQVRIKARDKAYAERHQEARRINLQRWYATHPTKRTEYRTRNAEHHRDHNRMLYHQTDPQVRIERRRRYRNNHREKVRARNRNRIALKMNAPGKHTAQDVQAQYQQQKGKCYYCHKRLTEYHVDHVIPLSQGGSNDPSNLVIACPTCNSRKRDKFWRLL